MVYATIIGRQLMWLYTLASPYGSDDASVAIKLRSWSVMRRLAASILSLPAFVILALQCLSKLDTGSELQTQVVVVAFTIVCVVALYVLAIGYTTPEDEFLRLRKQGYIEKGRSGNEKWLEYTIRYFTQFTAGMVFAWLGSVIVSIFLLYVALF